MTFPVIERELKLASRELRTYALRSLVVAVGALIFILKADDLDASFSNGVEFFATLQMLIFYFCAIEGVRAASDCLSEEERNGTLGLLFLTSLKGKDVVLGKMVSACLNSIYIIMGLLPLSSLALLSGGVEARQVMLSNFILLCFLFFCLSCGVFASSRSIKEFKSGFFAAAIILAACLIPEINASSDLNGWGKWSPPRMLTNVHENWANINVPGTILGSVLIVVLSLGLLLLSGLRIEKLRSTLGAKARERMSKKSLVAKHIVTTWVRSECLEKDPVRYLILRHRKTGWLAGALASLSLLLGILAAIRGSDFEVEICFMFGVATLGCLYTLLCFRAMGFFHSLRASGCLELLFTTEITPPQLIRGCEAGVARTFVAPISMVALAFVLAAFGNWRHNPKELSDGNFLAICFFAALIILTYHTCKWVAMLIGLVQKKLITAICIVASLIVVIPWFIGSLTFSFNHLDVWIYLAPVCILIWLGVLALWASRKLRAKLDNWAEESHSLPSSRRWFSWKRKPIAVTITASV